MHIGMVTDAFVRKAMRRIILRSAMCWETLNVTSCFIRIQDILIAQIQITTVTARGIVDGPVV